MQHQKEIGCWLSELYRLFRHPPRMNVAQMPESFRQHQPEMLARLSVCQAGSTVRVLFIMIIQKTELLGKNRVTI